MTDPAAQPSPWDPKLALGPEPSAEQQRRVRQLARAIGRSGLTGPFGHCSLRLDPLHALVCAPRPMAAIGPGEPGTVIRFDAALPVGVLGEVRIHQQVYARRPEVGAICRFISPQITALAALGRTPRPRHGFGSYFSPSVPFWPQPALVRDEASAAGVAELLGDAPALVLNVNGAVTVGRTAEQALALAWFLEDAARVELAALSSGLADSVPTLSPEAARQRATWEGRIAERVWDYLLRDDPE
jgi:HCOMODA/2-hydroxy-3-carboxy-muconic semialdehyde decarboxylase